MVILNHFLAVLGEKPCPKCGGYKLGLRSVGFSHLDANGIEHWNMIISCCNPNKKCEWRSDIFDSSCIEKTIMELNIY